MHAVRRTRLWVIQLGSTLMRELAAKMGSHMIEASQRISFAKAALLTVLISLFITICLVGGAEASEISFGQAPSWSAEAVSSGEENESDLDLAKVTQEFTTSVFFAAGSDSRLTQEFEISSSVGRQEKIASPSDYISVRGYSAFNHLVVALEATAAAMVVALVGYLGFRVYRRRKNDQANRLSNSGKSSLRVPEDDTEFAKTSQ